jgi:PmbA protein
MLRAMKIQEASQFLLERAKAKGANGAEVIARQGTEQEVQVHDGAPEQTEQSETLGLSLRLIHDNRQVVVNSSRLNEDALTTLFDTAWDMLPATPEVPDLTFTTPDLWAKNTPNVAKLELSDNQELPGLNSLFEEAKALEELCREDKRIINTENAWSSANKSHFLLQTMNGLEITYDTSLYSQGAVLIAGNDDNKVVGYDYSTKRHKSDLITPQEIADKAIHATTRKVGQKHIKSGKFPVIFEHDAARSLVGNFMNNIDGEDVVLGTTFLKDSLGKQVFGEHINIIEDPFRVRGFDSQFIDDEGIACQKRNFIENGVLTSWVLDLRTAGRLNMAPTGHASRGSALPHPSASNIYLEAGKQSLEEMMKDIGTGLLVTSLKGSAVNNITGDYSRGCEGFWIENGTLAYPVCEATIASTLQDIFKTMIPANDLELKSSLDAPSILIPQMDVSGK